MLDTLRNALVRLFVYALLRLKAPSTLVALQQVQKLADNNLPNSLTRVSTSVTQELLTEQLIDKIPEKYRAAALLLPLLRR